MSAPASWTGATLGRYRLVERLGQGGMATVYRAEDPTLGREVAVKVMHPFVAERSEASQRFEREARAIAGLRHPNVLALYDYQPAAGETPAYLVMELLSGPSLRGFLEQHGAPLCEVGAMIGLAVARALGAAHARAIVHRDVKPENVMLDGARVVLCDFGIARMALEEGVTASGTLLGSPAYMSPEQAAGEEIDARSDLFALGSLLYQLATGALPFVAAQPLGTLARIARGEHAPPTAKNPRVPRWLEQVIERCLQVDRAARFASAEEVVAALEAGLSGDGLRDADAELASYLRDPPEYNLRR
jgi:serine/threonine-protein kinase